METKNKDELKNAGIEQLSIGYDAVEDRLLFKIGLSNNHELSVWLTRRVAKSLTELFDKTPLAAVIPENTTQQNPHIAQEMSKNAISQNLDFSTDYQPRKPIQTEKSLLVQQCQILIPLNQPMSLDLLCTNQQNVNLVLNDELLMALTNMLQLAIRQANWDFFSTDSLLIPNLINANYSLH